MRYKEFNNSKVLEDCISLFWKGSFKGTPISKIVDVTKVNRFSLYHEFENKNGLLYASLDLYKQRYSDIYVKELNKKGELNEVITDFLTQYLNPSNNQVGCYLIYISTEMGDNDKAVKAFLSSYLLELEECFSSLLSNYEMNDKETVAKNLVMFFCNIMCYCHIQSFEESKNYIQLNLDLILN